MHPADKTGTVCEKVMYFQKHPRRTSHILSPYEALVLYFIITYEYYPEQLGCFFALDNKSVFVYNTRMKHTVKSPHYDMLPGTVVYKVGISSAETSMYGVPYFLVTEIEGDKSEGALRVIPEYKLEEVK
jgi:hypothetical protein